MIDAIKETLAGSWQSIENFLQPFLEHLDPSLFQNIILGILAIFIPFAIVFLTDILNSKEQKKVFEKMVLIDEVLGARKLFWISVIGIFSFAFLGDDGKGKDGIPVLLKIIATAFSIAFIVVLWMPFRRILKFSEGYKLEFEIRFLRSLSLSKSRHFRYGNKRKSEKQIKAWESFWSEKSEYDEKEFTEIFVSHVDDAFKHENLNLAVRLTQAYVGNLEKRYVFFISEVVLPKILDWHKEVWNRDQIWLRKPEKQQTFSDKKLQPYKKWFDTLRGLPIQDDLFWRWDYFKQEAFLAVAKILLNGKRGQFQFFARFKKHIDENEKQWEQLEDSERKEEEWNYIVGLLSSFCGFFFENIDSMPTKHELWRFNYPKEWKITTANSKERIPKIILGEFREWAHHHIFSSAEEPSDAKLNELINGIFPNVHGELFTSFLILFYSSELESAINRKQNSFFRNSIISYSGKKTQDEIQEMFEQQKSSQKKEAIELILGFPYHQQYEEILPKKLDELNGAEIREMCKESAILEGRRKGFIELIQLLLERVSESGAQKLAFASPTGE